MYSGLFLLNFCLFVFWYLRSRVSVIRMMDFFSLKDIRTLASLLAEVTDQANRAVLKE